MSTRSRIGVDEGDGRITSIYVHSDGYPDHMVPVLTGHYTDEEKVRALIGLGDLSSLGEEIGEDQGTDWFDRWYDELHDKPEDPRWKWCRAYGRDRGETASYITATTHSAGSWPNSDQECEYLFRDGSWRWRQTGGSWRLARREDYAEAK